MPARRFALFVGVSLLVRGILLGVELLDHDEAAHLIGSWTLLDGGVPYLDFIDNKPPLVYLYYALCQLVLGRGMLAVHLVTVLVTVPLTALALSSFFEHDRRGLVAGLAFLAFGAAFRANDMHAANCELLALLPTAWALALIATEPRAASPWRAALAGALCGLAALFKQQTLLVPAALGLVLLGEGRRRQALLFGLGFLGPLGATGALFAAAGAGDELLFWTFTYNLQYAGNPILVDEAVHRFVTGVLLAALVAWPLFWGAWRSPHDGTHRRRLAWAAAAATLPSIVVGWRFYPHYLLLLYVPLVLLAAARLERWPRLAGGWAALAVLFFSTTNVVGHYFRPGPKTVLGRALGERLRADACYPGGSLFVWGYAPGVYHYAGLRPASRFVLPQATVSGFICGNTGVEEGLVDTRDLILDEHRRLLLEDLRARPPTYVIDVSGAPAYPWHLFPLSTFPELEARVAADYELAEVIDGARILRRRGCAP